MKQMWKKIFLIVMCVSMLSGCAQTEPGKKAEENKKINIVATDFAPYDFAKNIAGDAANVSMLLSPGEEAHSYEPSPRDMIEIENCDVFVYTGGESEEWVNDILKSIERKTTVVRLMDCVELYEEETVEGMQSDEHGDEHGHEDGDEPEYDEHVWTAPANAIKISEDMERKFSKADPEHAKEYETNTKDYVKELKHLDRQFWNVVNNAKRKTIVFGDRFPLRYFVEEYGLAYYAAFPGCASGTEPSARTVAFLIDKVKADKIPVVFHIEFSNEDMANTICEDTGAGKRQFNACHNISKEQFRQGIGYVDLMKRNVKVLKEALQ